MKSLQEYSQEMKRYSGVPHELANLLLDMSADYGTASNSKIAYEVERARFWLEHKKLEAEKPVSDKTLEMMFIRDGKGQELKNVDIYLKGLEKLMSGLKASLRVYETEARNQY